MGKHKEPIPVSRVVMLHSRLVTEVKKGEPIPARALFLRDGSTERCINPAIALEAAVCTRVNNDVLALAAPDQRRAGKGKPRIERRPQPRFHRPIFINRLPEEVLRSPDSQIRVIRDPQRTAARTLGESAPRIRLDAPEVMRRNRNCV